jgi:carboxymethylenebutenolidase
MVEFGTNGRTGRGYFVAPDEGEATAPGVLVIQEWWGLVGHIKNVADRFAEAGFVALAPDLYHGETTTSPDDAGKLMMALRIDEAEKDLRGATDYLASHAAGDSLGVVGFCMGGQLALLAANRNPRIKACVDFYGIHPNVKLDFGSFDAAVLGLFAEKDGFVTPEVARDLEKNLENAGVETDFHIYPGVEHAFFNDERPVYDAAAASDAWERVLRFFGSKLKSS